MIGESYRCSEDGCGEIEVEIQLVQRHIWISIVTKVKSLFGKGLLRSQAQGFMTGGSGFHDVRVDYVTS